MMVFDISPNDSGSLNNIGNSTTSGNLLNPENNPLISLSAYSSPTQLNVPTIELQFDLNSTSLQPTGTLSITNGQVSDSQGAAKLSKVEFDLKNGSGKVLSVEDVSNFTTSSKNSDLVTFNFSQALTGLNLAAGSYSLSAVAYDKSGDSSNTDAQSFTVTSPLSALQFGLNSTSLQPTGTLSITNGQVSDSQGVSKLSKVEFDLKNSSGKVLSVEDVSTFTTSSKNSDLATFNFSQALTGLNLAAGSYSLSAIAYDKAGDTSNTVTQTFTIQALSDWFSQNLHNQQIINLARQEYTTDHKLTRDDMINILTAAETDGTVSGVIDATELQDLRTIVSQTSWLVTDASVADLANDVVNNNVANQYYQGSTLGNLSAGSSKTQLQELIDKWFLGMDHPSAPQGVTFTYEKATGSLFGNDGTFSYQDIQQGSLGDCYFLASLGEIALQDPSVIQNMFINNGDGTYTVKLFGENNGVITNSKGDYITVDSDLPTNVSGGGFAYYDNANIGIWVALAEKAYAQFSELNTPDTRSTNSYQSIIGGSGLNALAAISGIATNWYFPQSFSSVASIASSLSSGNALTADTLSTNNSGDVLGKSANNATPIYGSHEYMIIGANTTANTITLRNPWGQSFLGGGTITIDYNSFLKYFGEVNVA